MFSSRGFPCFGGLQCARRGRPVDVPDYADRCKAGDEELRLRRRLRRKHEVDAASAVGLAMPPLQSAPEGRYAAGQIAG
jgi:hypothetical protein